MKNKKIITLSEWDIVRIIKKIISEAKVDFTSCFKNFPEWLDYESTEISQVAKQGGEYYKNKTNLIDRTLRGAYVKNGTIYPLGTCEILRNQKMSAGLLSNIGNFTTREKAVTKTVKFCMKHLNEVVQDLKTENPTLIIKHVKNNFDFQGKNKKRWIEEYDFSNDIKNIEQISKCLYSTNF